MSLFGGITDAIFGGGKKARDNGLDYLRNVPLPVLKEINPELYAQVVKLNPSLEQEVTLGPSAMDGIALDPIMKQAQMDALSRLQDIGAGGSRDIQGMADEQRAIQNVNSNLRGNLGAIQQNMAQRGMSGGMSELVSKQMSAQDAANRQGQMELDLKAQAQQRALQALMQGGQMAGQMENQDFSRQSQQAQAKDAIARFNAQNSQQVRGANTDRQNQAQQWNAQNKQRIADSNVNTRNDYQKYNTNGLAQQRYDNELKRAGGIASQWNEIGKGQDSQGKRDQDFIGGLAQSFFGAKG